MPDSNRFEKLSNIGCVATIVVGLYLSSWYSYLLFHSLIEITTIAIAFTLFILTWNTRHYLANTFLQMLGVGYGFIALIDLLHTLAYKGMNVFPGFDANLPTQLWIAARYLQAVTLVGAPLFMERQVDDRFVFGGYGAAFTVLTAMIYSGSFPDCFIEGMGLTTFKINSEYLISVLLFASLYLIYRRRGHFSERVFRLIAISIVCSVISELSFTAYVSVYGFANLVGHFAKLAAFYLIYRAILVTGFRDPFELIFRDLKQAEESLRQSQSTLEAMVAERTAELRVSEKKFRSLIDNVPTAIVLHDRQGLLLSVNPLARKLLGLSADQILGKALIDPDWHFLREDGSVMPVTEYPVSRVLAAQSPLRDYVAGIGRPDRDDVIWVLVSGEPEYDETGAIERVIVSFVDITARKRAEAQLLRSEHGLAEAQRIAHLGNWELDLVKNVLSWSDEIYRIFEIDPEKFGASYEAFLDAIHPEDREMVNKAYTDSVKNKVPYDIVHRLRMRDGRIKYVNEICETSYAEDGKPLRSVGTVHDITERKLDEEKLQRLNRELRAIRECDQVLVRAEDEQRLLEDICRIVCDEGGYRMAWVGYAEKNQAKTVRPVAWAGIEEGYLVHADITWADTKRGRGPTGIAIRTGKTDCIRDFATEPKAAPWRDNALQRGYRSSIALPLKDESNTTFGTLTIYSTEPKDFSPEEIRLLEELAGDLAFGIMVLRARIERNRIEQSLRESEEEIRLLNQELEQRIAERTAELEAKGVELQDSQNALMNIVEDLNEKTAELERANTKLKEVDQLKSMFIASMSHELRTPLNSIIGFSSIILNEWTGPLNEEQKENIMAVLRSGKHLLSLINDVIDVSKIETGKIESIVNEFDIQEVVSEAVETIKKDIDNKGLELTVRTCRHILHTDRRRLMQCLLNVLSNAIKFTSKGSINVNAELSADGAMITIAVEDTGMGIGEKDLGKLFSPFVRLHAIGESVVPGTGLGLYLTQKLLKDILKGDISVTSTYGVGSRFIIRVPTDVMTKE